MAINISQRSAVPILSNPTNGIVPWIGNTSSNASTSDTSRTCTTLTNGQIIISRTMFIATITAFALVTLISLLLLLGFLCRTCQRRREAKAAKTWGHKSRFDQRISMMRKEVDDAYTRQYGPGCLMNPIPENPEMGSDSPVEMMPSERVWEVPAVPAKSERRSKAKSLFFDHGAGLWLPRR